MLDSETPEFDNLASSIKEKLQNYGIPVIDPHRIYETMSRRDMWHFDKSNDNKLALAKIANGAINFVQALQAGRLCAHTVACAYRSMMLDLHFVDQRAQSAERKKIGRAHG